MSLARAIEGNKIDIPDLFMSRGVRSNSAYMGATPLVHACPKKDFEMTKILLEHGADINIRSNFPNMPYDEKSAIDIAHENGDPQLIRLLIGSNAKRQSDEH
jgi:ankyrin repeat protein